MLRTGAILGNGMLLRWLCGRPHLTLVRESVRIRRLARLAHVDAGRSML